MLKFQKTADQNLQNAINRSIILNYLRGNGPVSRADISANLKISASAVSRVIDSLIKEKYVIETVKIKTAVGKRPIQLEINPERGYVLSLDLSQERLQMALYDFTGKLLKKNRGFTILGIQDEIEHVVDEVRSFLDHYLSEKELLIEKFPLEAISVGLPADIDVETGKISSASLYENWNEINFKEVLAREFHITVYVEKDVILSVLAEKNFGKGKDFKDVVFIEISSGVSAGIIVDNQLIRGACGSAGQIAFTVINAENLGYRAGNKGYLDKFASVQRITEKTLEELEKGKKTTVRNMLKGDIGTLAPSLVCEAALNGDRLANEIIDEIVRDLSIGIINLILAVNPQVVVLGGTVSSLPGVATLFVEKIVAYVKKAVPFKIPEFTLSSLGEDVVLIGASSLAIEAFLAREFPYRMEQ